MEHQGLCTILIYFTLTGGVVVAAFTGGDAALKDRVSMC